MSYRISQLCFNFSSKTRSRFLANRMQGIDTTNQPILYTHQCSKVHLLRCDQICKGDIFKCNQQNHLLGQNRFMQSIHHNQKQSFFKLFFLMSCVIEFRPSLPKGILEAFPIILRYLLCLIQTAIHEFCSNTNELKLFKQLIPCTDYSLPAVVQQNYCFLLSS